MTAEQQKRRDLNVVAGLIPEGSRVLDLGCGDGEFLRSLQEQKQISALGVEIDPAMIRRCIANGVFVIQSDLDAPLTFAEDQSFDVVVLSHTLQQLHRPDHLLRVIVRVGKTAVVSFINFGHFPCRWRLLTGGKMPETAAIPYHWYDTPNIHLGTISDFRQLCSKLGITILREIPIGTRCNRVANLWPNLLAPGCVFELTRREKKNQDSK